MEQQKILWTGLAAAFVLILVTLVAFLWMTSVKDNNPIAVTKGSLPASDIFSPIDPAAAARDDNPLVMQTVTTPVSSFEGTMPESKGVTVEKETSTTSPVSTSTSTVKASTPSTSTVKPVSTPKAAATPAPVTKTSAAKTTSTSTKSGTTAPAAPAIEYYIQVGSYSSQTIAEEAKADLKDRGLSAMITVKTVDGTDYYRVRIGPYQNKDEANKFLDWVKAIKAYSSSYLTEIKK